MSTERKKYAIVGLGGRSRFYYQAIADTYKSTAVLCGFCDVNQTRMDFANKTISEQYGAAPVNTYTVDAFDRMIADERPDTVIVSSIDRTHDQYIIRAMGLGCDVICEKPMTTDAAKCQAILDAVRDTGRELRVTFNFRYAPANTKIRELVMDGVVGQVTQVHFEWVLSTWHGADYFRRWHRDKRNSGGLMVHKATHHFDLVNWWIDSRPATVFAMGDLLFYGRANAEARGVNKFYSRAHGSKNAEGDPFALDMSEEPLMRELYLNAEHEDGYYRDQCVFGDGISIEDTMAVLVRYENNAVMTFSLNAYCPWEGYKITIAGTEGRIEAVVAHAAYINAAGDVGDEMVHESETLIVHPMHHKPYQVEVEQLPGGHGGGDPVLLEDIFGTPAVDRFNRAASHVDGAWSILTGIAANKSFDTGQPVAVRSCVDFG